MDSKLALHANSMKTGQDASVTEMGERFEKKTNLLVHNLRYPFATRAEVGLESESE